MSRANGNGGGPPLGHILFLVIALAALGGALFLLLTMPPVR